MYPCHKNVSFSLLLECFKTEADFALHAAEGNHKEAKLRCRRKSNAQALVPALLWMYIYYCAEEVLGKMYVLQLDLLLFTASPSTPPVNILM